MSPSCSGKLQDLLINQENNELIMKNNRHFRPFFGFGMLLGVVRNRVYVIQACSLLNSKVELPRA